MELTEADHLRGWVDCWSNHIDDQLNHLSFSTVSSSECSIFRVPNILRQTNEHAYEPRIISIGPYHRGKDHLRSMEVRKMHFLKRFLQRRGEESVKRYMMALYGMQEGILKCYVDLDGFDEFEFFEMMLLDGCFIIELIRECQSQQREVLKEEVNFHNITLASITRDLLLVENQLPFFVLSELIHMTPEPDQENVEGFMLMALDFFSGMMQGPGIRHSLVISAINIKNLLGLVYDNLLPSCEFVADRYSKKSGEWHPSNATELQEVGIKFKNIDQVKSLFNIKFENGATELQVAGIKFKKIDHVSLLHIKFRNGVLFIPTIRMDDDAHSILRNLIVHEQFHNYPRHVTDYVTFMDSLINTGKDVELLRRSGIIANGFGDDEVVATIFNRLGQLFDISDEHFYSDIYLAVKEYRGKGWNAWMAKWDVWMAHLRHNYFNTPWALISLLGAVILLILTALQTIYSLLSYYQR